MTGIIRRVHGIAHKLGWAGGETAGALDFIDRAARDPREWIVEEMPGLNPVKRIMCGDCEIVGWTGRPHSESFQSIADAHNLALAQPRIAR